MSKLTRLVQAEMLRIVMCQLMIIVVLVLVASVIAGIYKAASVGMGAFSYWLPTLIFMMRVSAHTGARAATRFMLALFVGEVVKLVLCGILFVVAIKYLHLQLGYALLGLVGAIMAFWIASITVLFQTKVRL